MPQPSRFGAMFDSATSVPLGLARNLVSGSKVRFVDRGGGYDLDLTYITDRIIAMGLPASSIEAAWRNSLSEVARFLHEKHPQRHRVYNLCDERDYDQSHFHAALHLPFPDHHPPDMDTLLLFVADARAWLLEDEQNIVAVHCKAGKGRTGVMIAALLMAMRHPGCANAHDAIALFRARRTRDGDACRNAGQIRYVHYYEEVFYGRTPPPRTLRLLRIELRRKGGRNGGPRFGCVGSAAAASPFVYAVRTSIDAANGADAANPLSVASGSSVSLKLLLDGGAPIVLEPLWRPLTPAAAAGGGAAGGAGSADAGGGSGSGFGYESTAGAAGSRSLAQLSAWFASDPDLVLSAWLTGAAAGGRDAAAGGRGGAAGGRGGAGGGPGEKGLVASADVKVTMAAQGALAVARVREKLWRLNFHCAYETLHSVERQTGQAEAARSAGQGAGAVAGGEEAGSARPLEGNSNAPAGPLESVRVGHAGGSLRAEEGVAPTAAAAVAAASGGLDSASDGASIVSMPSLASCLAAGPGAAAGAAGALHAEPSVTGSTMADPLLVSGRARGESEREQGGAEPDGAAAGALTHALPAGLGSALRTAGSAADPEYYLLFDRDGLDDCRGFANSYEFELRIYVQPLP